MFRSNCTVFVLFCLIALAATAAPALAQPHGLIVVNPALMLKTVTVVGAGETLALAESYALAEIRTTYFVLSYSTSNPLCSDLPSSFLVGNQLPEQPVQFCSIEVTARVLRKALWIVD